METPEIGLIVQAINRMADGIMSRVEATERDFIGHLQKVEERLDQLVNLTKTVAVLQTEAAHRDDRMEETKRMVIKMGDDHQDTLKRIHERIDKMDAKHSELDDRVKTYFRIGSGMWLVLVAWFFVYDPVGDMKKASESIKHMQDEVKEINAWRFGQTQQQPFVERKK